MRFRPLSLIALLLVLVAPAGASAQNTIAPPGNSGVDEYVEVVPSADGPRHSGGSGGGAAGGGRGVSARTQQALSNQGTDGAAVSQLAGGVTSSQQSGKHGAKQESRAGTSAAALPEAASSGSESVPAAVARAVTSASGGMGPLLPLLLGAVLLAGALAVMMRRRAL